MKNYCGMLLVIVGVILFSAGSAEAGKRKCAEDYRRFCSQWGLETRGLQNCMRSHGDRLTHACVRGLIAAGAVSQAEVDRRRAALGRWSARHDADASGREINRTRAHRAYATHSLKASLKTLTLNEEPTHEGNWSP
jgi:hypothetical protein